MGFRFRRSIKILPGIRLNLSGGGASVSLGPRGLHYTVGSKGTRVTAGIPGTGLSWSQYSPYGRPPSNTPRVSKPSFQVQPVSLIDDPIDPALTAIDNAPAEEINALSASELAPLLNSANRKYRVAALAQLFAVLLFGGALIHANQLWIATSALYATIFVPLAIFLDRYRRSVKVVFEPEGALGQIAEALDDSFEDLIACESVWRIKAEGNTADWKRNAGATVLNQRKKIFPAFGRPACIRGKALFPALKLGADEIYLLPDAALILAGGVVAAVNYHEFEVSNSRTRFIEEERVPSDSPIVAQTWRYVNKEGGPDRRFRANKKIPICIYGELSFRSEGGLNCKIHYSNPAAADRLCAVIEILHRTTAGFPKSISYIKMARAWPSVAFFACLAGFGGLQLALIPNAVISTVFRERVENPAPPISNSLNSVVKQPVAGPPLEGWEEKTVPNFRMVNPVMPNQDTKAVERNVTDPSISNIPLPRPRPKF